MTGSHGTMQIVASEFGQGLSAFNTSQGDDNIMRCRRVPRQRIAASLLAAFFTLALTSQQAWTQGSVPSGYRFEQFDAPGADPVIGGTYPLSINDRGVIAGVSCDSYAVCHGFQRNPDGSLKVFDAPGVSPGVGNYLGTQPQSINARGEIAGIYEGADFVGHGFLREPDGKITVFDDPAEGVGVNQGTWAYSINDKGEVAGAVTDPSGGSHGFVRLAKGAFTDFDFPGETSTGFNSALINNQGVTAGYYATPSGSVAGYERNPGGRMTTFVPAVRAGATAVWTFGLAADGTTLGRVNDNNSVGHAFMRSLGGKSVVFDVPNQILVSNPYSWGSELWGKNEEGVILGEFIDASFVVHSFLLIPKE